MGLRGIHLFFIAASILLALVLGGYCLREGSRGWAVTAFAAAAVLIGYGVWFVRKTRVLVAALALVLLGSGSPALACQSCYGAADSPLIDGARLGVWALLAVTLAVQAGFVAFFFYLLRRARRHGMDAVNTEWSDLQRGHLR